MHFYPSSLASSPSSQNHVLSRTSRIRCPSKPLLWTLGSDKSHSFLSTVWKAGLSLHLTCPQQVGSDCGWPEHELTPLSHCPAHISSCWTVTCLVKSEFLKHHSSAIFILGDLKHFFKCIPTLFGNSALLTSDLTWGPLSLIAYCCLELTRHYCFLFLACGNIDYDSYRQGASYCLCSSLPWISIDRLCASEQEAHWSTGWVSQRKGWSNTFIDRHSLDNCLMEDTQKWSAKTTAHKVEPRFRQKFHLFIHFLGVLCPSTAVESKWVIRTVYLLGV